MTLNYAFGFSVILLLLVGVNIYFFYTFTALNKPQSFTVPSKLDPVLNIFREIYDHLNYLPSHFKSKNHKYLPIQQSLLQAFERPPDSGPITMWQEVNKSNKESLYPVAFGAPGKILHAIKTAPIALVDNAPKGTQLKLLFLLEGKQKLYFKPKRYNLTHVVKGNIYAGFDRHNSEVFAYYLAMVLNFKWIAPSTIRKVHVRRDIVPFATAGLMMTMNKNESGSHCIYGQCFYCKPSETVCPDSNGELEGAAILFLDKPFQVHKSPWRRSYSDKKMDWETDHDFCNHLSKTMSLKRILNLVDIAIFDFLIQNGDRHRYEVYKDKIVLMDNGKGLGNPAVDEMDILAPLYQCCMLALSTWHQLELVSGGSLTDTIKLISASQEEILATEEHFKAVERRLLKIYATVQYCIQKHGKKKMIPGTFLYFAYGSNLLKRRIHINNPTAEFVGIGRLEHHQLDFIKYSDNWGGCSATIIPVKHDSHIWGAVWRLHNKDMSALDRQEGVDTNWYFAKEVDILTVDGVQVKCRTYQQIINPLPREKGEELPTDRLPSSTYMDCIVNGAIECQLPPSYIKELKKIPNNGNIASDKMLEKLGLKRNAMEMKKGFHSNRGMVKAEIHKPNSFLYFAYGVNMLTFGMHMHVPSAILVSIARLDNYRLDFIKYSSFWGGPTATLVPTANAHVWGVIWRIDSVESDKLDKLKEVDHKKYFMRYGNVLTPYMGYFNVRIYIQAVNPLPRGDRDVLPVERWPSWTYQQVMILGAKENGVPHYYIRNLKAIPNNGEEGALRMDYLLNRYAGEKICECRVPGKIKRESLKLVLR